MFNSAEYFGSTDDAFIFKVVDVMHIPARRFNYTCIVLYVIFFRWHLRLMDWKNNIITIIKWSKNLCFDRRIKKSGTLFHQCARQNDAFFSCFSLISRSKQKHILNLKNITLACFWQHCDVSYIKSFTAWRLRCDCRNAPTTIQILRI